MGVEFATIDWGGRQVRIEYEWLRRHDRRRADPSRSRPLGGRARSAWGDQERDAPLIVFLHEGLGSRAMWKDFPARLCEAAGARGLVYSRPGYGRSTPRDPGELWDVDFLHRQAHEVLPALLAARGVDAAHERPWLFGHSDGASIALLHAARFPERIAGAVAIAPHIHVEDIAVDNIERARQAYLDSDLKQRLAKHHDDPDSAFWGWNRIWLAPSWRAWSIEREITAIRCPLLAVQGHDDEYGTLEQIRGIARLLPQTQLLELPDCGHSVHRDQPEALIDATVQFLRSAG